MFISVLDIIKAATIKLPKPQQRSSLGDISSQTHQQRISAVLSFNRPRVLAVGSSSMLQLDRRIVNRQFGRLAALIQAGQLYSGY